jgi:hypothetical protein
MDLARTGNMHRRGMRRTALTMGTVALAAAISACALTQREKPKLGKADCVFLSPDVCGMLKPTAKENEAGLRYTAPDVDWRQYTAAMIPPIALFGDARKEAHAAEAQALVDYAHAVMVRDVGKELQIVSVPGKGVMKIQGALTNASAAVPVLRTVSMVVPQARALNTLKYIVTGTYAFVGGAQGELLVTDSLTGEVLAAAVDRRVGGGSLETAAVWQWGDAQHVMDTWAEMTASRIAALRAGKASE